MQRKEITIQNGIFSMTLRLYTVTANERLWPMKYSTTDLYAMLRGFFSNIEVTHKNCFIIELMQ